MTGNTHKFSFLLLLLFVPFLLTAQIGVKKKAQKEFNSYSYINAQKVYLRVVEKGYASPQIYKNLADSYYFTGNYEEAAKWYKRLFAEYGSEAEKLYYLRATQSYNSIGDYEASADLLEQYIEEGGEGSLAVSYENDPEYLKSIYSIQNDYVIEKVSVNSESSDFTGAYYQDSLVVFASNALESGKVNAWNKQPFLNLYVADITDENDLENKRAIKGEVNTPYHESSVAITEDGETMYFTRNNFKNGELVYDKNDKIKTVRLKIFEATKSGDSWGNVHELPFNSNDFSTAYPVLNPEEDRLYFSSDRPGTEGMSDIWYVEIKGDGSFGEPVNLGETVNTVGREAFPFISKDSVLYFSSDGHLGLGGLDVFRTPLNDEGEPTEVYNLGEPINSPKDDFGLIIKPEDKTGFFTSNRDKGKSINDDIYNFEVICRVNISGKLYDKNTGEPVVGLVQLLDENNQPIDSVQTGTDGLYFFEIECETKYILRGSAEGYATNDIAIDTPEKSGEIEQDIPLDWDGPCAPDDLGCKLDLQPIYFDFDKWDIRPDAAVELAKIAEALKLYPKLNIHIESHTDSRGSDSYNMELSERRAQSTLDWLIGQGVAPERMTAQGYGESQLVNDCDDGVPCTDEQHQLNRRSMFIIQD